MTQSSTLATLFAILTSSAWAVPSSAQAQPADSSQKARSADESLFGDNRTKGAKRGKLHVGGRLSLTTEFLMNDDLAGGADNAHASFRPEARLELSYEPVNDVEAFASLELGFDQDRSDGRRTSSARVGVREAYLLMKDVIFDDFELQVGRQDFDDGREWLYDKRLDGLRLAYDRRAWRIELAWAREALVRKYLSGPNPDRDKVDNFIFRAQYEMSRDWKVAAYVLRQKDRRASNISPIFFGVQSEGQLGGGFDHWLEYSIQRGEAGQRKLRASAFDVGIIYNFPMTGRPSIFGGYARGSGGGDAKTTRTFRQTGLQDNEDRISGLGQVKYYGELLDPDLSNIAIFTAGAGVRPSRSSSLEIVGHIFRQASLRRDDVRGSPITAELNGLRPNIGTEIDAIFAIRLMRGLGLEAKLGWFSPSSGFDARAREDAIFGKLRIVRRF